MPDKKDDIINKIVNHFKDKDGKYFIEKVNQNDLIHIKYISKWMNSMSLKDVKITYENIISDISKSHDNLPDKISVKLPVKLPVKVHVKLPVKVPVKVPFIFPVKYPLKYQVIPLLKNKNIFNNVAKILKGASVQNIKDAMVLSMKALKDIHIQDDGRIKEYFTHNDITPLNIVYTDSSYTDLYLKDFGSYGRLTDINGNRDLKPIHEIRGTPLYMSTMRHIVSVKDYMDDFQSFAWVILDLLGDKPIGKGMPWGEVSNVKKANVEIYEKKIEFMKKYNDSNYIKSIENGTLSSHNISVIRELANYTYERGEKVDKYETDIKLVIGSWNTYYSVYNEKYYTDIEKILNKLK